MSGEVGHGAGLEKALEVGFRRKWLVAGVFAIPCAAALGLAASLPDIYRASATVVVERQQVPEAVVRPSVGMELETRLQTISQQILSRARLQDLIDRFGLYPELKGRIPREAVIQRMRRDLRLDLKGDGPNGGRGSMIAFDLSYRGRDPRTVERVANTLASFYVEEDQKSRERQTSGAAEFLKVQLDVVKKRLDEQDRRVGEFKKLHSGELPEQSEVNLAALERLNTELRLNSEAQIRALERRDEAAKMLVDAGVADPGGDTEGTAGRIARLRSELADLRTRFSDKYPEVLRLKQQIDALERRAVEGAAEGSGAAARTASADPSSVRLGERLTRERASLKALQDEERKLRRSIDDYQRRVESAPQREQELRELSRDSLSTKELYESLSKRFEDAQIAESMETGQKGEQFRILDAAVIPEEPAGPNRRALIVAGLVLSLGLAVAAAALAEQIDTSFHTTGDLRSFTRVPVLISIPRIVTDGDLRRGRWRFWAAAIPAAAGLALIVETSRIVARHSDVLFTLLSIH